MVGFSILGFLSYKVYDESPPIPIDLGQSLRRIDVDIPLGFIKVGVRPGRVGDGSINPDMPGVPLSGYENMFEVASGGKEGQPLPFLHLHRNNS